MKSASLLPLLVLAAAACSGSESGTDEPAVAQGGPFRPKGNGKAIGETAACNRYQAAIDKQRQTLSCGVSTGVACPDLIQLQASEGKCADWDEGALEGCEAFFAKQPTCDTLNKDNCALTVIAGTGTGESPCTK